MDNKEAIKSFSAALFFVLGILLIVIVIFVVGKDKGIAQSKFRAQVLFRSIGGLTEGAPIRLLGVNVGTVASIDFLDKDVNGRRVAVTLNIWSRFKKQIEKSTKFVIKTEGVLGEKLVEVYVEEGQPSLDLSHPVIGEDPLDVQDLAESFAAAAESFTKTSNELSRVDLERLMNAMGATSEALMTTSKGVNSVISEMDEISRKSKRLLDRIEQKVIDGNLFKVF